MPPRMRALKNLLIWYMQISYCQANWFKRCIKLLCCFSKHFLYLNLIFPQFLFNIIFTAQKSSENLTIYPFQIIDSFVCVHASSSKYSWFSVICIFGATKPMFSRKYLYFNFSLNKKIIWNFIHCLLYEVGRNFLEVLHEILLVVVLYEVGILYLLVHSNLLYIRSLLEVVRKLPLGLHVVILHCRYWSYVLQFYFILPLMYFVFIFSFPFLCTFLLSRIF